MTGIEGKVVAITGASSGIGEVTAELLASRGARLVLGARRIERLADLARRMGGEYVRTDVTRREDLDGLVRRATDRFGRLDVLVSNAGLGAVSPLDALRVDDWDRMVDVNVKGLLHGIAAALAVFRALGSGHFVGTASTAAYRIVPGMAVYAATKTAMRAIHEGLRQEAGETLRVTTVSPGMIATGFAEGVTDPAARAEILAARDRIAIPPEAIARAVAFAIEQPSEVDVNEIVVRPAAQAWYRNGKGAFTVPGSPRSPGRPGRLSACSRQLPRQNGRRPLADNQFTAHADLFDLSGKYALVTGGTKGIGMMIARGLLQAGARVVISSRNADTCAEAQQLLSEFGDVRAIPADLSRYDECQRLADLVQAGSERLDILVNNAGAMWREPLETFPGEAWDAVLDLNLKAPFWLVQALLPALRRAGTADDPARVVNIGSIAAIHVAESPNYSYAGSKAGLHQLTRVLARELGPQHITVNAVAPGPFPSQMMASTLEAVGDTIAAKAPLRRLGRDDDMAGIAVFLSGRAGSYLTGTIIPVDGGIATTATGT